MEVNTVVTYREARTSVFGPEYQKINGVYKRDMANGGLFIEGDFAQEEFGYLADTEWTWTEKVDGTNIRLHFNGESITVGGRTDSAQIPGGLMFALGPFNNPPKWREVFGADISPATVNFEGVTIYGEGYGPKIQNGGRYRSDAGFIVFDVRVGRWWLKREDVEEVAARLGMPVVPVVQKVSLHEAIVNMEWGVINSANLLSAVSTNEEFPMEGLVGTPSVPLFDRRGARIVTKLKVKDFEDLAKHRERKQVLIGPNAVHIPGGVQTFE